MSASPTALDRQVAAATVRASGKRWCASCFTHHPAEAMFAFRQPNGAVIYRCQKWIDARARHRKERLACLTV